MLATLVLPPVHPWSLANRESGGAWRTVTAPTGTSSSSARIMVSVVWMPWPISDLVTQRVMTPSDVSWR